MRAAFAAAACLLVSLPGGCGEPEQPLRAMVAADQDVAREVLDAFGEEHEDRVLAVYDSEAAKTTAAARAIGAAGPGAFDVWWSGECWATAQLAEAGVLVPLDASLVNNWPPQWRDPQGRWIGFAARVRCVAWDEARLREAGLTPPADWLELAQPKWGGGVIAMADPRFGTTRGHLGAVKAWLDREEGPGAFERWAAGLAANAPRIVTDGNSGALAAVVRGEALLALTDSDDFEAARARGSKVVTSALPHRASAEAESHDGALVFPSTVAIVAGSAQTARATELIRFIAGPEGEDILAKSAGAYLPLANHYGARVPDWIEYAAIRPLGVTPAEAAAQMDEAVRVFLERVRADTTAASGSG